jgi:hypothetical protein
MLRQNVSSKMSHIFGWTAGISAFLIIAIGGMLKVDGWSYRDWPTLQNALYGTQSRAWWLIPLLVVVSGLSRYIKTKIGSSATWHFVDHLLGQYREALLEKRIPAKEDPEHFHRITLFRHVRWRWTFCKWPWTGWMVPVARTGHTTQGAIPRFRANANDPDNAEGIAGQAWARRRMVSIYGLVEVNSETAVADVERYAQRTFMPAKWVNDRRQEHHARSFLGIPLEVNGAPWGSIVVDSRSDGEISTKTTLKNPRYKMLTEMLSKLLQQ